jgi:hypothetical protein
VTRKLVGLLFAAGLVLSTAAPAAAQNLQRDIAEAIADRGWWDETGTLDEARMDALVAQYGGAIGFAYTDRSFDVESDPNLQAAALLSQSALGELTSAGSSVQTVVLVTGDERSGSSDIYTFSQVILSLDSFGSGDVVDGFAAVANVLTDPNAVAASEPPDEGTISTATDQGAFTVGRLILLGAIAVGILVLWMTYSSRRTTRRTVTTADARGDTSAQLTAMSDLIIDLEPRITIANNPDLKERFAAASLTYSDVRESAESASTGHEVADLRLEIAEARWKLDVIEAELEGRPAPPQPHRRDNSGSAWDSTRGTGNSGA